VTRAAAGCRRRRLLPRARALAVVSVVAFVAASCAASPASQHVSPPPSASIGSLDPALASFYTQRLAWKPCGDGFDCATVQVPLSYQNPGAASIDLAMIKLAASDPGARIGSLFVNPGGPGGSGVDYARAASDVVGEGLRARYDVVGFDPRGVGQSSPIRCLSGPQTDRMMATLGAPDAANTSDAVANEARSFGADCLRKSPSLTPNIGTVPAAQDLDILRAVVGDPKLNYVGRSYGTFLGVTYAGLFPTNVGRFVLDGAIDSKLTLAQLARGQADGFQLALSRFIGDCPRHADCPLPRQPGKAIATIHAWLDRVANQPLRVGGRALTKPLALTAILGSFYLPVEGWPRLRSALGAAFASDAGPMFEIVDDFTGRESDGKYGGNEIDTLYAVNCLDHDDRADLATTKALAAQWSVKAPTFGAYFAWGNLPCSTWPTPATDAPHEITAADSGPILVVGTKYDPATPYAWAESMAKSLANAALLSWDGDGHTAYRRGSACVDRVVDAFLLSGQLPVSGGWC